MMNPTRWLLSLFMVLVLGNPTPAISPINLASPTPPDPFSAYEFIIVRAYYSNPQSVIELARWMEPWEVHSQEGYLVVGIHQTELEQLKKMGFRVEIDWEKTRLANQPVQRLPDQIDGIPGFPCYRTVQETYASAQLMTASFPHLAEWIDIGDTWEKTQPYGDPGFNLMVLRLTNARISSPKPRLFIMASLHAREYAPAELVTRFAEYLLHNYGVNPDVTWILDHQEIHLLLQANPDGRKLAETRQNTSYIWWRKNTNQTCGDPDQRGVDLNRNFEFQWGLKDGSSSYPCSSTYRGASAASEPETQAIQGYLREIFPDQRGEELDEPAAANSTGVFLDIHSYGDLVLWPWGFTNTLTLNDLEIRTLGQKFAFFNRYEPEQAILLYPTSGTTDDFGYGDLGLAAYTFEVGDDAYSFYPGCNVFENTILPENIPAFLYAAKAARAPYLLPTGPDITSIVVSPTLTLPGQTAQLIAQVDDTRYYMGNQGQPPVMQNIMAVEYYIDSPPWITTTVPISYPLSALDGNFNQMLESAIGAIDTSSLGEGRHIIFARAQDEGGNWGPFSAGFLYIASIFLPIISR